MKTVNNVFVYCATKEESKEVVSFLVSKGIPNPQNIVGNAGRRYYGVSDTIKGLLSLTKDRKAVSFEKLKSLFEEAEKENKPKTKISKKPAKDCYCLGLDGESTRLEAIRLFDALRLDYHFSKSKNAILAKPKGSTCSVYSVITLNELRNKVFEYDMKELNRIKNLQGVVNEEKILKDIDVILGCRVCDIVSNFDYNLPIHQEDGLKDFDYYSNKVSANEEKVLGKALSYIHASLDKAANEGMSFAVINLKTFVNVFDRIKSILEERDLYILSTKKKRHFGYVLITVGVCGLDKHEISAMIDAYAK